ncbi:cation:proton antiporter [Sporosarcina ureilytica]|uniref:Sodium:proton exchanger n=1 Tax=Sporosarcina ureilytica TaxID=298596 RepID=A0A1D8JJL7_9BACL|nr:sodium:proton antiporter [Sporosarcina ureilytica]AOV08906.1 sodium:proton exchanger [Sporosarcina ureilytica]
MFNSLLFDLMLVVLIGIFSQWMAWRFRMPAIVVMSVAGLLVGPFLGIINPEESMGDLFSPFITIAVALILFEGSLLLDFKEIRGFNKPVLRIVTIGAFIAWIAGSLAAHYVAGLSLSVAFVIGGLFIVTGPTVILPLLRQARLKPRPAAILKWEGIVVDPFGALLAVFAFEFIRFLKSEVTLNSFLLFFAASIFAVILGCGVAWFFGRAFDRGGVPEYLKSPVLFAVVIFTFVLADEIMQQTGLLAVTAMGMTMANMNLNSIKEIRHFKENISVLLISSIFVMLTASLSSKVLLAIFNWKIMLYVLAMLIVVRPLSIWLSTIGTDLSVKEKFLIGWIAPRGIVALTVSGYFASVLGDQGYRDADILTAITFALVFSTVVLHGFTIGPLSKKLNLTTTEESGVLIVGGSRFAGELAKSVKETGNHVLMIDRTWASLAHARKYGLDSHIGNILTEQQDYDLDLTPYRFMLAMTRNDSYNAHVCEDFVPSLGREHLYQTAIHPREENAKAISGVGGHILFTPAITLRALEERVNSGHVIRKTIITKQYSYTQYLRERDDKSILLYILRPDKSIEFFTPDVELQAGAGDTVVTLTSPAKTIERVKERLEEENRDTQIEMKELEDAFHKIL